MEIRFFLKIKSFLDACGDEMSKEWSCTDKSKDKEHQMARPLCAPFAKASIKGTDDPFIH